MKFISSFTPGLYVYVFDCVLWLTSIFIYTVGSQHSHGRSVNIKPMITQIIPSELPLRKLHLLSFWILNQNLNVGNDKVRTNYSCMRCCSGSNLCSSVWMVSRTQAKAKRLTGVLGLNGSPRRKSVSIRSHWTSSLYTTSNNLRGYPEHEQSRPNLRQQLKK